MHTRCAKVVDPVPDEVEKQLLLYDRPANGAAPLVVAQIRHWLWLSNPIRRNLKIGAGVQNVVLPEFVS